MCGAIRPTNPIGPQTATTAPTINDTLKNSSSFVWLHVHAAAEGELLAGRQQVQFVQSDTRRSGSRTTTKGNTPSTSRKLHDALQPAHHPAEHAERCG